MIMRMCLIVFLIGWFRRTLHIPEFGGIYKNVGILLGGILGGVFYKNWRFYLRKYFDECYYNFGSIIYSHFQLEGKSIKSVR